MLMCLIGIAEAFQYASSIMGQRGVAAAFGNDDVAIAAGVHVGVKIVVSKEGSKRHRAVEDFDLRLLCTEEEPSGIECLGVKVREDGVYQLFISLYWPGSVTRSMAKKTWNFGRAALPPLVFM